MYIVTLISLNNNVTASFVYENGLKNEYENYLYRLQKLIGNSTNRPLYIISGDNSFYYDSHCVKIYGLHV